MCGGKYSPAYKGTVQNSWSLSGLPCQKMPTKEEGFFSQHRGRGGARNKVEVFFFFVNYRRKKGMRSSRYNPNLVLELIPVCYVSICSWPNAFVDIKSLWFYNFGCTDVCLCSFTSAKWLSAKWTECQVEVDRVPNVTECQVGICLLSDFWTVCLGEPT